ncbi:PspA/IM30 family protein [Leptotrichia sp. oral taxon 223]|uniref:PspA/IM30 family protein n=1 Tax=Leptotrichia sp. oral taxon 223 TaxID=712363 RepID=UPI0015BAF914|nr:PspA/IM30 family protein [Leptotrichia sp. oral taxon 223]NWO18621.1 PspA/IM30 family protein [Leptotrichia sp. oral taxon 223]
MASILGRFKTIMASNINALLDKMEDPEKMIDQYLRDMEKDLGSVKAETVAVMAQESAAKRKVAECENEIKKMEDYAKKALQAGNEADARMFLEKKGSIKIKLESLEKEKMVAVENSLKMREMHDKLTSDIQKLNARKNEIKAKIKMAKSAQKISAMTSSDGISGKMSSFNSIEEKADRMLDEANATIELNSPKKDEVDDLMKKYDSEELESSSAVDDEMERLKKEMGL